MLNIDLSKLDYEFSTKPLLIGGMAMQYYGLRPAGADIDFVITVADYTALAAKYPDHTRDLWGDKGVCVYDFEMWICICLFGYDYLAEGAIEADEYRIITLEKLLFLKALAMKEPKYLADLQMIVEKIFSLQHQKEHLPGWPRSSF
jgi:hypothetical protein